MNRESETRAIDKVPSLVPELYVSDFEASLYFYVDLLGFVVSYDRPEDRFASISFGTSHLMLEETPARGAATPEEVSRGEWRVAELKHPFGRGINFEIAVSDVAPILSRLSSANYPLVVDVHEKSYRVGSRMLRVRQFLVADPDGYLVRPSQALSELQIGDK